MIITDTHTHTSVIYIKNERIALQRGQRVFLCMYGLCVGVRVLVLEPVYLLLLAVAQCGGGSALNTLKKDLFYIWYFSTVCTVCEAF